MAGAHGGGYWMVLFIPVILVAVVLAAFILWWAHREESQDLVKFAAAVLSGPWVLMTLIGGLGAPPLLGLAILTSWVALPVGIGVVMVSRKIRRKERHRRAAADVEQPGP